MFGTQREQPATDDKLKVGRDWACVVRKGDSSYYLFSIDRCLLNSSKCGSFTNKAYLKE
jgi:hypothetical protein